MMPTRAPWYPDEEWADIPGYWGRYWVSSHGRIRTGLTTGHSRPGIRKLGRITGGYAGINLCLAGQCSTKLVHQLVARAFIGSPPPGLEVCHGDGDPMNPRVDNLRYDTRSANMREAWAVARRRLKTHCKRGHKFTEATTYRPPSAPNARVCRVCLGQFGYEAYHHTMVDPEWLTTHHDM